MKLRLWLSHETLAVLLGFYDRKTVSNMLQSARVALMKDFVPQHLGFEHTVAVKIDQPPKKRKMFDFYFSDERC